MLTLSIAGAAAVHKMHERWRKAQERVRDSLDPQIAERVVVSAFTSDDLDDLDAGELTKTKMLLLAAIVADEHAPWPTNC